MKKIFTLVVSLLFITTFSQQKALTEDGKEVVLFDNGNWKFVNESDAKTLETIFTNENNFEKARNATFLMKSKRMNVGVFFDPKNLTITPQNVGPTIEYFFTQREPQAAFYGFLMTESLQIATLKNLKDLLISQVQKNVDYFRLKESEYRMVNGMKVLYIRYAANTKGIDFEYAGHYYINGEGYCGVVGFSPQNMFEGNFSQIQEFINGISPAEKQKIEVEVYTAPPPPMRIKN